MTCVRLLILSAALSAVCTLAMADGPAPADRHAFEQRARLGRGVNILAFDPIWQNRREARFQERYFGMIEKAGFRNVRINLYPFRDGQLGSDHRIAPAWFDTLDWAIRNAQAAGLIVILDLHEYEAMGDDPSGNRDRLLAVWRQLAAYGQHLSDDVLFEVLNEPCNKLTPERWNSLLRDALRVIRASNPGRTVIIGPASWNSIDALPKLELPEDDRNLIVTVHYYNPFAFTHQGAPWTMMKNTRGVRWQDTADQRQAIADDFQRAEAWARAHSRPIFLGEFGALETGDMTSRARWAACAARQAEQLGWSWDWWQFEDNFALYDTKRDAWVEPLRRALLPELSPRDNQRK